MLARTVFRNLLTILTFPNDCHLVFRTTNFIDDEILALHTPETAQDPKNAIIFVNGQFLHGIIF